MDASLNWSITEDQWERLMSNVKPEIKSEIPVIDIEDDDVDHNGGGDVDPEEQENFAIRQNLFKFGCDDTDPLALEEAAAHNSDEETLQFSYRIQLQQQHSMDRALLPSVQVVKPNIAEKDSSVKHANRRNSSPKRKAGNNVRRKQTISKRKDLVSNAQRRNASNCEVPYPAQGKQLFPRKDDSYGNANNTNIALDVQKTYKCILCEKYFSFKEEFENHQCGLEEYACPICNSKFESVFNLHAHRCSSNPRVGGDTTEKHFQCSDCGKSYSTLRLLKSHRCDIIYYCKTCQRKIASKHSLQKHKCSQEMFYCSGCDKYYASIGGLKKHQSLHMRNTIEVCKICNKKFGHIDYLREHMITHTKERRYYCTTCKKGFNRRKDFESHQLKIHDIVTID